MVEFLRITTQTLGEAVQGQAFTGTMIAVGGRAPYVWSLVGTALPAGLTLNAATGQITGTTNAPEGGFAQNAVVTDARGRVVRRTLGLAVNLPPAPSLSIGPGTVPNGRVGQSYSASFSATGGTPGYTITVAQGAAPTGLSMTSGTVTGTLTLVFEPNAVNNADDPAVQFSSGGRTVTFTIPVGQTAGVFPVTPLRILSGTVAGTIRIRTATAPESSTPVPESTVPIARSLPVLTAGTAQIGTGTFTVQIDGYSNTREISAATFRLTAAGAPLGTTDVPVAVGASFTAWYQSAGAAAFGGQFRLVLPFTVTGSLTDIESVTVTVTVTNGVGTSQPIIVRLR